METTAKCLRYSRVSSIAQDYERQIIDLDDYCDSNNLEIAKTYEEKTSGVKLNRDFLTWVIDYFTIHKEVKHLVVQEVSRLGRTFEIPLVIQKLNELGVCTHITNYKIKTLNSDLTENDLSMQMVSNFANYGRTEAKLLKYRQKQGIELRAKRGYWHGGSFAPFGYDIERDKINPKITRLVKNEYEAKKVEEMFAMMLRNEGSNKIARWLISNNIKTKRAGKTINKKINGIPTKITQDGKIWSTQTIRNIIKNPLYYGKMGKKDIIIDIPAIITKDVYDRANEQYLHTKKGKHTKNKYLLDTKLIICGVCGKHYYPNYRTSGKINNYRCGSNKLKIVGVTPNCNNNSINIDKLNKIALYSVIYNDENRNKIEIELNQNGISPKIDRLTSDIVELEKNLKTLDSNERNLIKHIASGNVNFTQSLIDEQLTEINNNRNKTNIEIINKKGEINQLLKIKNDYKNLVKLFQNKDNATLLKENINKIITKIVIQGLKLQNPDNPNEKLTKINIYTANNNSPLTFLVTRYSGIVIEIKKDDIIDSIRFLKIIRSLTKKNIEILKTYKSKELKVIDNFNQYFKK